SSLSVRLALSKYPSPFHHRKSTSRGRCGKNRGLHRFPGPQWPEVHQHSDNDVRLGVHDQRCEAIDCLARQERYEVIRRPMESRQPGRSKILALALAESKLRQHPLEETRDLSLRDHESF